MVNPFFLNCNLFVTILKYSDRLTLPIPLKFYKNNSERIGKKLDNRYTIVYFMENFSERIIIMPTSSYFIDKYALLTGVPRTALTKYGHIMRDSGLLPSRGEMTPADLARLIIALLSSQNPRDVLINLPQYWSLVPVDDKPFMGYEPQPFGAVLETILAHPEPTFEVNEIKVCRNFPEARVIYTLADTQYHIKFKEPVDPDLSREAVSEPLFRLDATLNGGIIQQFAIYLADKRPSAIWIEEVKKEIEER